MIFAKIDFINLIPFYVYIKKNIKSSQTKSIINYKKSYPSKINQDFHKRRVDGAFISSIKSKRCKCTDIGIVAKKEVLSVLSIPGDFSKDTQSDTSNILAQVLDEKGKIIIGDKALQYYYQNDTQEFVDLAQKWHDEYKLPFVFARLCYTKNGKTIESLANNFVNTKVKIPQYVIKKYAKRTGLSVKQISQYLDKISYNIGSKEKKSLNKFFKLSNKI